ELPTKTMPPGLGKFSRSAFRNAAISDAHGWSSTVSATALDCACARVVAPPSKRAARKAVRFIEQLYNRCATPSNSGRYPGDFPSAQGPHGGFYRLHVAGNLDLREDFGDAAIAVENDRRSLDAHVLATVQHFLLPDPES